MILFDNVDINSVARVKIEDIKISGIQFSQTARQRAVAAGADFVRNRAASRTVTVTFAVLQQDRNARQAAISAINAWAKSDKEYKLQIVGHPGRYLMAVCTEKPSVSTRQWWDARMKLVFSCISDPYWLDESEKSVACGTAFTVLGDAPPVMRIERSPSAAVYNQSYAMDGRTMTFSTIPAGDLVIDLEPSKQTAKVGTTSIMQYYNVNSKWIIPRTGAQTVTGTGTVKYRERYE